MSRYPSQQNKISGLHNFMYLLENALTTVTSFMPTNVNSNVDKSNLTAQLYAFLDVHCLLCPRLDNESPHKTMTPSPRFS